MTESSLPEEAAAFLREVAGEDWTVEPLAGDASVRAYYRIRKPDGSSVMLTWYPPELREQLRRFIRVYEELAPHAPLPNVIGSSDAAMLQRDVGDRTLYDVLHDDREEGVRLYRKAVDVLIGLQQARPATELLPPFTAQFFFDELEMAREFYVEKLKGLDGAPLVPMLRKIAENIASHPYVLCHRDYHGQNIHVVNDELFVIDYQDLRMGPDTYDLASLLRDRGVARIIGRDTELELVDYYGRPGQRYFETLLQRSIKILGTFARQVIVRGRTHYLDFIPPALESIGRCLEELPEFRKLGDVLQ
jgi:N-acetylmuramate 1-kinase